MVSCFYNSSVFFFLLFLKNTVLVISSGVIMASQHNSLWHIFSPWLHGSAEWFFWPELTWLSLRGPPHAYVDSWLNSWWLDGPGWLHWVVWHLALAAVSDRSDGLCVSYQLEAFSLLLQIDVSGSKREQEAFWRLDLVLVQSHFCFILFAKVSYWYNPDLGWGKETPGWLST